MSTFAPTLRFAALAATLVVALAGGIASAQAQSRGESNGGGHGGSLGSDGKGGTSAVILYGKPGNCPPTRGCDDERQRPRVVHPRGRSHCDAFRFDSPLYRRCKMDL